MSQDARNDGRSKQMEGFAPPLPACFVQDFQHDSSRPFPDNIAFWAPCWIAGNFLMQTLTLQVPLLLQGVQLVLQRCEIRKQLVLRANENKRSFNPVIWILGAGPCGLAAAQQSAVDLHLEPDNTRKSCS